MPYPHQCPAGKASNKVFGTSRRLGVAESSSATCRFISFGSQVVHVGSKVRYLSDFSAALHFGERPESAQPRRFPSARLRWAFHPTEPFGLRSGIDRIGA
jgi:hypothetical protein